MKALAEIQVIPIGVGVSVRKEIIRHCERPKALFHYTTQEGLLGIIDSRKVCASHISHLTDD